MFNQESLARLIPNKTLIKYRRIIYWLDFSANQPIGLVSCILALHSICTMTFREVFNQRSRVANWTAGSWRSKHRII